MKWKQAPWPGGAGGPDATAVLGDNAAADGEAETGAAHGARVGRVDLLETFEDVFELVGGDAAALVGDGELGFVGIKEAGGEGDFTA